MSSTSTPVFTTEIINQPFGKTPNVLLDIQYQDLDDAPSSDEMKVMFGLLDALLETSPLAQWKH